MAGGYATGFGSARGRDPYEEAPYAEPPEEEPVYDPGGGGGGVYDPASDPAYAAYMAALDLSLAQQQQNTERARQRLLGQQDQLLYDTTEQGERSREGISGGMEARGMYNSGQRLQAISRQQANQATRESRIRQNTTQSISDLEYSLAQALAQAQMKRQQAEQGIFS